MSEPLEPKRYPDFSAYRGAFRVLVEREMERLEAEFQAQVREGDEQDAG